VTEWGGEEEEEEQEGEARKMTRLWIRGRGTIAEQDI